MDYINYIYNHVSFEVRVVQWRSEGSDCCTRSCFFLSSCYGRMPFLWHYSIESGTSSSDSEPGDGFMVLLARLMPLFVVKCIIHPFVNLSIYARNLGIRLTSRRTKSGVWSLAKSLPPVQAAWFCKCCLKPIIISSSDRLASYFRAPEAATVHCDGLLGPK